MTRKTTNVIRLLNLANIGNNKKKEDKEEKMTTKYVRRKKI